MFMTQGDQLVLPVSIGIELIDHLVIHFALIGQADYFVELRQLLGNCLMLVMDALGELLHFALFFVNDGISQVDLDLLVMGTRITENADRYCVELIGVLLRLSKCRYVYNTDNADCRRDEYH